MCVRKDWGDEGKASRVVVTPSSCVSSVPGGSVQVWRRARDWEESAVLKQVKEEAAMPGGTYGEGILLE